MGQTTREFTVGAWPKGITVGNWREGGCAAQSLIHSYSFISTTVDKPQLYRKAHLNSVFRCDNSNIRYTVASYTS